MIPGLHTMPDLHTNPALRMNLGLQRTRRRPLRGQARTPAAGKGRRRLGIPHGAAGGAAVAAAAGPPAAHRTPGLRVRLHKIGDPIDCRILARVLGRQAGIGTADGAQPTNPEVAGGIEHRQAVVDE